MKEILKNILESFHNNNGGYSAKKLSIFAIVSCVVIAHVVWLKHCYLREDFSLFVSVITIDFSFITALFGVNVADKKINKDV